MNAWRWSQLTGFQLCWLGAVWWGNAAAPWLLLALTLHLLCTPSRSADLRSLALVLPGFGLDMLLWYSGWFLFAGFPWWLLLLWASFVLTLGHGLAWLQHYPRAWMALGAMGGAGSYLAGAHAGAVLLPRGWLPSGLLLATCWALLLPLLLILDQRNRRELV